jgi:hypothetical protein
MAHGGFKSREGQISNQSMRACAYVRMGVLWAVYHEKALSERKISSLMSVSPSIQGILP